MKTLAIAFIVLTIALIAAVLIFPDIVDYFDQYQSIAYIWVGMWGILFIIAGFLISRRKRGRRSKRRR